jgi:hypothetical protein
MQQSTMTCPPHKTRAILHALKAIKCPAEERKLALVLAAQALATDSDRPFDPATVTTKKEALLAIATFIPDEYVRGSPLPQKVRSAIANAAVTLAPKDHERRPADATVAKAVPRRHASSAQAAPVSPLTEPPTSSGQHGGVQYHDPTTWPRTWTAADIEQAVRPHLKSKDTSLEYVTLSFALGIGDLETIKAVLAAAVKPPQPKEVNIEEFLTLHLNNLIDKATMKLQERKDALQLLDTALLEFPGSQKRLVVICYSPRGSGKTQLVKWFLATRRSDAMKCGRVIVRCCDKGRRGWMQQVKDGNVDEGLCALILMHVSSVTGRAQDASCYLTPEMAYASWIRETSEYFSIPAGMANVEPLIVLDTCEKLALDNHKTLRHETTKKPYTLLEAFCLAVPSPHRIFAIGCNAMISTDEVFLTMANVTKIPALAPLTEAGYALAVRKSWKQEVDDDVRIPLYHWAGGLPRLLRLAHKPLFTSDTVTLACGSLCAFERCFDSYQSKAQTLYKVSSERLAHAYACLLASSTKARVSGTIAVDPQWSKGRIAACTYDEAAMLSIGSYDEATCRFTLPPITLSDQVVSGMRTCPILPSQLHPFLTGDVIKHFGKHSDVERGRLFEKPFMYAVYARYLLVHLGDRKKQWVPLAKVFEGALHPDQIAFVGRYEVNLSGGVVPAKGQAYGDATKHTLTYVGGSAHHDAYVWCRKAGGGPEFAAPLQLRHGQPKAKSALVRQLGETAPPSNEKDGNDEVENKEKREEVRQVPFLLSVNPNACDALPEHESIIMVNADAMSSVSWLGAGLAGESDKETN